MSTHHKLFLIVLLYTIVPFAKAQQTETPKQALQNLKQIFSKKNKTNTNGSSTNNSTQNANANNGPTGTPSGSVNLGKGVYMAGKLAPNVKYVDCDLMSPFNWGAAIVQKGSSYGLIDTAGNFIIPYNKYPQIYTIDHWIPNGIFFAYDGQKTIYLNYKGKVILDPRTLANGIQPELSVDKQFILCHPVVLYGTQSTIMIIDREGKKTTLTMPGDVYRNALSDSVVTFQGKNGFGFINMQGKVTDDHFVLIDEFNQGVSLYGSKDQYGIIKYGIVSSDGRMITQPIFSTKPDGFYYGVTMARASQSADFDRAYIDRTGKIFLKETQTMEQQYGYFGRFDKIYAYTANYMLDRSGHIISQTDFLNSIGIEVGPRQRFSSGSVYSITNAFVQDRNLRFSVMDNVTKRTMDGIYDIDTHQAIIFSLPPSNSIVTYTGPDVYFLTDPISHYTYAKMASGQADRNGNATVIEGYVNRKGEYVLVKGQAHSDF